MGRLLLSLVAAAVLIACTASGAPAAAPAPSAPPTSSPGSPVPATRAPDEVILGDGDTGLPRTLGRDHVGLNEAASEEQNEPLALTQFRRWGWLEESVRTWAGGARRVDESLLLLTRAEGARLAFEGWAGELGERTVCRSARGLDECALGPRGLVGRAGRYAFRLAGSGVDLEALATVQAARVRQP